MKDLAGRLRDLRNAEAQIAVALPAALASHWMSAGYPIAWPLRAAGLALVSALLLQGALYRQLKHAAGTMQHLEDLRAKGLADAAHGAD